MRHTDDDFLGPQIAATFDDLLHRRNQAFTAIQPEPFGAHVFDVQEFLKAFGLDQFVQDRFAAFTGELDFLAEPLNAFL